MGHSLLGMCVAWGLLWSASSHAERLPNLDVRIGLEKSDVQRLERLRREAGLPSKQAGRAEAAARAAATLASERGGRVLVTSAELGLPEVVGPGPGKQTLGRVGTLASESAARAFLSRHAALYGLSVADADALVTDAVYTNPAGNLEWVRLAQHVNGLPVFRGEITVALRPDGEIVRTTGQLAGGIEAGAVPATPRITALEAADAGAAGLDPLFVPRDLGVVERAPDGARMLLRSPRTGAEVKAELVVFPLGEGAATLAWSMVLWGPEQAYYVVVGAQDGTLLFRKSITDHAAFSYLVYPSDSPTPTSPGPSDPNLGTQGATQAPVMVTVENQLISASPIDVWLPTGATVTDGNNAEAGPDLIAPDGIDAPVSITSPGVFGYGSNPPPGLPPPGSDPGTALSRNAASVNAFYWANRFHDLTYDLGFTEAARNLQHDNYGRGGLGNDRMSMQIQESTGTNNANSSWPPDGSRGRMQSYIWTGPTPDRDGAFDASVILHELGHGIAQRLHNNSAGLVTQAAGSLTEGWGDFYATALLSEPDDPVDGVYAVGGYSTYQIAAGFAGNHYYGIRRFPLAIRSSTGGAMNRPHNPLTFADVDPAQIQVDDGAFPRGPIGPATPSLHNNGEIWSLMLWEGRAELIGKYGAAVGNRRMLQYVTDGMKLDPVSPDFLSARDSILAAACAVGGQDEAELWRGFATRGLGVDAQIVTGATTLTPTVIESFAVPTGTGLLQVTGDSSVSCPVPGRRYSPGETVRLALSITNSLCGTPATNVVVSVDGGASVAVGTIAPGATVARTLDVVLPLDAACGTDTGITLHVSSDGGSGDVVHTVPVGSLQLSETTVTNTTPIQLPAGQPGVTIGNGAPYPSNIVVAGVSGVLTDVRLTLNNLAHSYPGDLEVLLVSPSGRAMTLMSDAFGDPDATNTTFTIRDDAELAMPSTGTIADASAYRPTDFNSGSDTFGPPAPGTFLPAAPTGSATLAGFAATDANPNGQWSLYLVDDANSDSGLLAGGWSLTLVTSAGGACEACNLVVFGDGFED